MERAREKKKNRRRKIFTRTRSKPDERDVAHNTSYLRFGIANSRFMQIHATNGNRVSASVDGTADGSRAPVNRIIIRAITIKNS